MSRLSSASSESCCSSSKSEHLSDSSNHSSDIESEIEPKFSENLKNAWQSVSQSKATRSHLANTPKGSSSPKLSESDSENIDSLTSTQIVTDRTASRRRKKRKRENKSNEKSIKQYFTLENEKFICNVEINGIRCGKEFSKKSGKISLS